MRNRAPDRTPLSMLWLAGMMFGGSFVVLALAGMAIWKSPTIGTIAPLLAGLFVLPIAVGYVILTAMNMEVGLE